MRTLPFPARALFSLVLVLALWPAGAGAQNIITTVAGGGSFSGSATSLDLAAPIALAQDAAGNTYISINQAAVILRVNSSGQVSVVAGNGSQGFSGDNGLAINASLFNPTGIAVDGSGNLYIVDTLNERIRRVDAGTQIITTVAGNGTFGFSGDGGLAINASLSNPHGVALDNAGNIFIADTASRRIRRVDAAGIITTVAGTGAATGAATPLGDGGPAINATFRRPLGVSFDAAGNLFIADTNNNRIREVAAPATPNSTITTVAGNGTAGFSGDGGPATSARLSVPRAVAFDSQGNMYIPDSGNSVIRKVAAIGGAITSASTITTVAGVGGVLGFIGDGGSATTANLNFPTGVLVDGTGNLFIADANNLRVRQVAAVNGAITSNSIITTVAGGGSGGDNGPATSGILALPVELAFDSAGNLYIGDASNNRIRKVGASGAITTVAGSVNAPANFSGDGGPATSAGQCFSQGVAVDGAGNIFIADSCNNRIREVNALTGTIITVVGTGAANYSGDTGPAGQATLNFPEWVAFDSLGNLYIADTFNNVIRKVAAVGGAISSSSIITTVAGGGSPADGLGDGGPATSAALNGPEGLSIDTLGNIFIADSFNNRIRKVDTSGNINTVAGNGTAAFRGDNGPATTASINTPNAVTVDRFGNILIPDSGNNVVRRVDHATGIITTLAGTGVAGFSGDGGPANLAALDQPAGVTLDSSGTFYVADAGNNRVRRFQLTVQLFPASLDFGAAPPGFTSAPKTVTLTNLSGAPLTFSSPIAIAGTNSADFAETNNCPIGMGLSPGASCTISLTFTPSAIGGRTATLTVTDSDPTSPQMVPLTGAGGTVPTAVLTPSKLDFGTVVVGNRVSQTVNLANTGNVTLQISSISVSDFFNFLESDTCAGAVIAGGTCTITVTFQPTQNIPFTATLTVTDDAADSPQVVSLSGTGGPGPNVSLFPQSLSFGNQLTGTTSPAQSVTLFNNGSAALTISSIQAGPDFAVGGNCAQGVPISQGSICNLTVNFAPTVAGSLAESIVISDNAPGSPHLVGVSGSGVAPAPVASLSAPALNFGPQAVGTASGQQSVVVTNAGTAPLNFPTNAVAIAPAGNFTLTGDQCSEVSRVPGGSCVVFVVFQPQASGPLTATLMFTDNAAGSPQMVQLSGQGLAPLVTLSTASIGFGAQLVGTASGAQPIILGNAGSATLVITSITPPPGFTETDNCNGSLAARASCVIQVTFAPAAPGSFTGNLVIADNVPGSPQQTIQLSGTAENLGFVASPTAATVAAGQAASYAVTVTPARSFGGMVQFSCAGAPAGANCMVTPGAVSLGGGQPGQVMVTVTTTGRGSLGPTQNDWPPMRGIRLQVHLPWLVWLLTLALVAWLVKTQKRRPAVVAPAVLLAALLLFSVACGGGGASSAMPSASGGPSLTTTPTPPGNYVIVVTASSSGSPTQTLPLALTVTR